MRKESFDANPGAGSAMRRMRGLSREIGFALALTAAAAASAFSQAKSSDFEASTVLPKEVALPISVSSQP